MQRRKSENHFIKGPQRNASWGLHVSLVLLWAVLMGCYEAPCRVIEHRSLEVTCEAEKSFSATHLDSAALFEAFLRNDCEALEEISGLVTQVDFSKEVVFCGSGPLNDPDVGCLRQRKVKGVETCIDGVQFLYEDAFQPQETTLCSNQLWSFCEVLDRNEVRKSLDGDSISETIAF